MSLQVIEVSKGYTPQGNVMKFGGTSEYDFYVICQGSPQRAVYQKKFIEDFTRITKKKNFEFSKNVNDFYNRIK